MFKVPSDPNKLVFLSAAIAAIIAENLTADELNFITTILSSISENLSLIAFQKEEKAEKSEEPTAPPVEVNIQISPS